MATPEPEASPGPDLPSVDEIRQRTLACFGRRPCLWQCECALAQLRACEDIICISGTGSGKTLCFWMPLLFRPDGVQIVITPLNILGGQNRTQLERFGISAVAISSETATPENYQAIASSAFRVVIVSPELAFKPNGAFSRLWRNAAFVSKIIAVIWDEAHCISSWSSFRPDYGDAGRLRAVLPKHVTYLLPSATLPRHVLVDVTKKLQLRRDSICTLQRSNDRPNVYIAVQKIVHSLSSFKDLDFLVPDDWQPGIRIPRFLVFFDNIEESVKAAKALHQRVPPAYRKNIVWFNSDNTPEFREYTTTGFQKHQLYGLYCTDSFGMGVDIPDIELVVQWRVSCDMNSLWQRFGRAARGPGTSAVAILLAESKYFDEERAEAVKRTEKRKRAADKAIVDKEVNKRRRLNGPGTNGLGANGQGELRSAGVATAQVHAAAGSSEEHPMVVDELTVFERLRVSYEQSQPVVLSTAGSDKAARTCKNGGSELSSEMDHLVNAATRSFKCYRAPITAYYGNDALESDNHSCNPEGDGCRRCRLTPSPICCFLCTPTYPGFAILTSTPAPNKSTTSRASQVDTKYAMDSVDRNFRRALHAFRRSKTLAIHGKAQLHNNGTGMIMGDEILSRIADCARAGKIYTAEALARETKWSHAAEYGDDILKLIESHYPAPPAPEVLQAAGSSRSNVPTAPRKCGACGEVGHIRTNRNCPKFQPRTGTDKENTPAAAISAPAPARLDPTPTAVARSTAA